MKLSPWFDCRKDGYPVRSGIYEWEIHIEIDNGYYHIIHSKAYYSCINRGITLNNRFIAIKNGDQWRGIVLD